MGLLIILILAGRLLDLKKKTAVINATPGDIIFHYCRKPGILGLETPSMA